MTDPTPRDRRLLDHEYDGIQEYDNPLPRWWVALFWATIVFSVLYVLNIPVLGKGPGRIAEYDAEMARASALAAAAAPAGPDEATLLALAGNDSVVAAGRATFAAQCVACHGPDGGGVIGPNLTDPSWIHGGAPVQIHTTVTNGVLTKGMPAWGKVLAPDVVNAVVAYVLTLRGTTPANPKAPEGDSLVAPAPSSTGKGPAPPS